MKNLDEINLTNSEPTNDEFRTFFGAISRETRTRIFAAIERGGRKKFPLFEKLADELRDQPNEIKNIFRRIAKFWGFVDLDEDRK